MEKRDYLMQQIEQLGQVLAQLLAFLLGIKNKGEAVLSIEEVRQTYRDQLDISLELIQETPAGSIIEVLTSKVKHMDSHLDKMGDILQETADIYLRAGDEQTARELYEKTLVIFEHLQASGNSFSMEGRNCWKRPRHGRPRPIRIISATAPSPTGNWPSRPMTMCRPSSRSLALSVPTAAGLTRFENRVISNLSIIFSWRP